MYFSSHPFARASVRAPRSDFEHMEFNGIIHHVVNNQPTRKQINQWKNQSMNSPEKNPWIYESMTQLMNKSNSPNNQTTKQLTNQSINQHTHQSINFPTNQCTEKYHTPSILTQGMTWNFSHCLGYPDSTAWRIVVYVVITHKPGVLSGGHFCLVV